MVSSQNRFGNNLDYPGRRSGLPAAETLHLPLKTAAAHYITIFSLNVTLTDRYACTSVHRTGILL